MPYDRYPDDDFVRDRPRDRDPRSDDHRDDRPRPDDRHFEDRPRAGPARRAPVPTDETRDLIASSKVEGTPVYGRDDQRLGTVKALMIDKYEGQVRYAVLAHATGFLGLDQELVPVRWDELRYDERRGGYRVGFTAEDVRYTLERRARRDQERSRDLDRDLRR